MGGFDGLKPTGSGYQRQATFSEQAFDFTAPALTAQGPNISSDFFGSTPKPTPKAPKSNTRSTPAGPAGGDAAEPRAAERGELLGVPVLGVGLGWCMWFCLVWGCGGLLGGRPRGLRYTGGMAKERTKSRPISFRVPVEAYPLVVRAAGRAGATSPGGWVADLVLDALEAAETEDTTPAEAYTARDWRERQLPQGDRAELPDITAHYTGEPIARLEYPPVQPDRGAITILPPEHPEAYTATGEPGGNTGTETSFVTESCGTETSSGTITEWSDQQPQTTAPSSTSDTESQPEPATPSSATPTPTPTPTDAPTPSPPSSTDSANEPESSTDQTHRLARALAVLDAVEATQAERRRARFEQLRTNPTP